ncbi:MAG: helix-turn-helix domain-containing protein [Clostridiales bacterium]|nr:helix-turn-helix domain-containing protein [Clostridiales bacterium]
MEDGMFYKAELDYLMRVMRKMHLQALLLERGEGRDYRIDFGFRKFLGIGEYYERLFRSSGLWSEKKAIYRMQDEFCCTYVFLPLPQTPAPQALLIGPYITFEMSREDMARTVERYAIPVGRFPAIEEYYKSVPVLRNEIPLFSMLTAFGEILWGDSASFEVADLDMEPTEPIKLPQDETGLSQEEDTLLRMKLVEARYRYENELMEMVAQGQTHRAEAVTMSFYPQKLQQRLSDTLRNMKNYLIIGNTLMRKAAERGGVHPVYLDSVSSDFARKIENLPGLENGQALMEAMAGTYSRLVREHSVKQYSPIVQNAVTYIEMWLANDLSLGALASVLNVNASYLSALFRSETGQTVTEYVTRKRMQTGAHLLCTTQLQVQTVAQHCGIFDVNYFTKLFKKYYKLTPTQFRSKEAAQPGSAKK